MPAAELADDATKDEINEYVDQVMQEAEEDKEQLEDKTDSQQIAEEHDEPAIAETDSGSEDTADEGDETGTSEDQAWLDDDLKAEVAAYGIDEGKLSKFTSREELERAMLFFDSSALEAGRKAMAEGDKDEKQDKEADPVSKSESKEGQYEISQNFKEGFDDDLVAEMTGLRDHYESRLDAIEARFEEQQIDNVIDSLGHTDLFGKTGKENSKQLQRRQDLVIQAKALQNGLQGMGRGVDLDQSLFNRVAKMVFADELDKKLLKSKTRKVSKQSNGRMGGSAARAHDQKEPLMEEMERLYKELDNA